MRRHIGRAAFIKATLVGGALALYVQAFPRRDKDPEAATTISESIPARTSGAAVAGVQQVATIEPHEQPLAARKQESPEVFQATLGQSEDDRRRVDRELQAVQGEPVPVQTSDEERQTEAKRLATEPASVREQVPDAMLREALDALGRGKTKRADALFAELESRAQPAIDLVAGPAFERGRVAYQEGRWLEARRYFEKADRLVPAHTEYSYWAARVAQLLGGYSTAAQRYKVILSRVRDQKGDDAAETAAASHNLALLYWEQGRFAEAEPLYKQAIATDEKQLPADHPTLAGYYNDLAVLYQDQGRLAEAEPLLMKAVATGEKVLPADHPDLARWYNNLARVYHAQGRFAEAEPLYRKALAIDGKVLPADRPELARWYGNLARLYRAQGRFAEAEPLYKKAVAMGEKVLPADHLDRARWYNNLGVLYQTQGRFAEAQPLYRRALEIFERKLGSSHSDTRRVAENLAGLLKSEGRLEEADALLKKTHAGTAPPSVRLAGRGSVR